MILRRRKSKQWGIQLERKNFQKLVGHHGEQPELLWADQFLKSRRRKTTEEILQEIEVDDSGEEEQQDQGEKKAIDIDSDAEEGEKLNSNHSMVVSGAYYNPFQGSQGPQEGSEAKILTFWPKKSFYGNAHISGTRRPTGLAQVSKRPLDQGLRTWPFRLSVPLLASMIA